MKTQVLSSFWLQDDRGLDTLSLLIGYSSISNVPSRYEDQLLSAIAAANPSPPSEELSAHFRRTLTSPMIFLTWALRERSFAYEYDRYET